MSRAAGDREGAARRAAESRRRRAPAVVDRPAPSGRRPEPAGRRPGGRGGLRGDRSRPAGGEPDPPGGAGRSRAGRARATRDAESGRELRRLRTVRADRAGAARPEGAKAALDQEAPTPTSVTTRRPNRRHARRRRPGQLARDQLAEAEEEAERTTAEADALADQVDELRQQLRPRKRPRTRPGGPPVRHGNGSTRWRPPSARPARAVGGRLRRRRDAPDSPYRGARPRLGACVRSEWRRSCSSSTPSAESPPRSPGRCFRAAAGGLGEGAGSDGGRAPTAAGRGGDGADRRTGRPGDQRPGLAAGGRRAGPDPWVHGWPRSPPPRCR